MLKKLFFFGGGIVPVIAVSPASDHLFYETHFQMIIPKHSIGRLQNIFAGAEKFQLALTTDFCGI